MTTKGSIVTSLPNVVSAARVNRLGRDHGHAGLERGVAQACLHDLLGFGELALGVDAAHFILAGLDHNGLQSQIPNDSDRVAQIIFALAVGIADLLDDVEGLAAVEGHHAGIAEGDRTFRGTGVGLFTNGHQPVALDHEPAVAGGVGQRESRAPPAPRRLSGGRAGARTLRPKSAAYRQTQ